MDNHARALEGDDTATMVYHSDLSAIFHNFVLSTRDKSQEVIAEERMKNTWGKEVRTEDGQRREKVSVGK